jgi:hypothetical protein
VSVYVVFCTDDRSTTTWPVCICYSEGAARAAVEKLGESSHYIEGPLPLIVTVEDLKT